MSTPKRINPRTVAEAMWGTGGTSARRTNRPGAYYYSCSGHGGYVVMSEALTPAEREAVLPYVKPIQVSVLERDGIIYAVDYGSVPGSRSRRRSFRVPAGCTWGTREVFAFEEDCDWSALECFTGIRLVPEPSAMRNNADPDALAKRAAAAVATVARWYPEQAIQNDKLMNSLPQDVARFVLDEVARREQGDRP